MIELSATQKLTTFDDNVFSELRSMIDDDVYELLEDFEFISQQLVSSITKAAVEYDLDTLANASHTLKSNSSQLGAIRLGEFCRLLEEYSRAGRSDNLSEFADKIENELASVLQKIRSLQERRQ